MLATIRNMRRTIMFHPSTNLVIAYSSATKEKSTYSHMMRINLGEDEVMKDSEGNDMLVCHVVEEIIPVKE